MNWEKIKNLIIANKVAAIAIGAVALVAIVAVVVLTVPRKETATDNKPNSNAVVDVDKQDGDKADDQSDNKVDDKKDNADTETGIGLQVVDPEDVDPEENSTDVSEFFDEDGSAKDPEDKDDVKDDDKDDDKDDVKDDEKDDDKDDDKDDVKDDNKDDDKDDDKKDDIPESEEGWGAFY